MIDEKEFLRLMEEVARKKQEHLIKLDKALEDYLKSEKPNYAASAKKYGLTRQQVRNHYMSHLQKVSNSNNDSL